MRGQGYQPVRLNATIQALAPILGCWQKDLSDGHLTVMVGIEGGEWHLSISHRVDTRQGPKPGRNPTWEEIREARYQFVPDEVTMAMFLPPKAEYVNVHDTTFHLWQVEGVAR